MLKKVNLPKKVLKAYLFTQKSTQKRSQKSIFPQKSTKKNYYSKKQLKKVTFHRITQERRKKGVLKVSLRNNEDRARAWSYVFAMKGQ